MTARQTAKTGRVHRETVMKCISCHRVPWGGTAELDPFGVPVGAKFAYAEHMALRDARKGYLRVFDRAFVSPRAPNGELIFAAFFDDVTGFDAYIEHLREHGVEVEVLT